MGVVAFGINKLQLLQRLASIKVAVMRAGKCIITCVLLRGKILCVVTVDAPNWFFGALLDCFPFPIYPP